MLIEIDNNKILGDLSDQFNESFPELALRFYKKRQKPEEMPLKENEVSQTYRVDNISKKKINGILDIKSWYRPRQVEEEFEEKFGLHVRVFYRKNNEWQAVKSNQLTLLEISQSCQPAKMKTDPASSEEEGMEDVPLDL